MKTFSDNVLAKTSLAPINITGDVNGDWVDTQGYENAAVLVELGVMSGTCTVAVWEVTADPGSDITLGAAHALATTGAMATTQAGKATIINLNLSECLRYIRVKGSVGSGGSVVSAVILLFNGRNMPPTQERTAVTVQS